MEADKVKTLNKIEPMTCVKVQDAEHLEEIKQLMKEGGYRFFGKSEKCALRNEPYLKFSDDFVAASDDEYDKEFTLVDYRLPTSSEGANIESRILAEKVGAVDMVKKPNHYQLLPEYEVKDVNKALLDKIESSDFDMSLYEAGWYQQAMQYFMRFYAKNGLEDLEKGVETMQFVIDSLKQRASEVKRIEEAAKHDIVYK